MLNDTETKEMLKLLKKKSTGWMTQKQIDRLKILHDKNLEQKL